MTGKTVIGRKQPNKINEMLVVAVCSGSTEAVNEFLNRGADVNTKGKMLGITPLMMVTASDIPEEKRKEVAEILISRGADVNAQDKYGMTPLTYACLYGDKETAKVLLEHGADPNAGTRTAVDVLNGQGGQELSEKWNLDKETA